MFNFGIFKKGLGIFSPRNFVYGFSRKMFLKLLYYINWQNFIVFTSWDIGQYVYYNYLLTIDHWSYLSTQVVFLNDQQANTKS